MDRAQRALAMVQRGLDARRAPRAPRRPRRRFGERHEAALVQLERGRMGELAGIEEGAQGHCRFMADRGGRANWNLIVAAASAQSWMRL